MNHDLSRPAIIDSAQLNGEFYFSSLVEQAVEHGLLDTAALQKLQFDTLTLLAKVTERFCGGYSSSVTVERAQSLMHSLLFTVSLALKSYSSADDAARALKENSLEELYQAGKARLQKLLLSAKTIHGNLLQKLVHTNNTCHRDTLTDGIGGFFQCYDPDFGAHEKHITADYPLLVPLPPLAGIEFIKAYVSSAYYENEFFNFFDEERLRHLLYGYERDYTNLIVNLYEPIFIAALGCALCGADVRSLNISAAGTTYLTRLFRRIPQEEISGLFRGAFQTLVQTFHCSDGLQAYMTSSLSVVVSGMQASLKSGTLHRFFPLPAIPQDEPQLLISYGSQMDDEVYRKLLSDIAGCADRDRLELVYQCVRSLADLESLLLDADFTEQEVLKLLTKLSLPETAALLRRYRPILEDDYGLLESELRLRGFLQTFLAGLPAEQLNALEKTERLLQEF